MALVHFIVNPATPGIGGRWPHEEQQIKEITTDFESHIVRGRLHAEHLTKLAIREGAKLIVCVGDDKTLGEVVNGLCQSPPELRPALTIHANLQRGDTVRSLSLRDSFIDFLKEFLDGRTQPLKLDLGEVEFTGEYGQPLKRFFLNGAGFGFSSTFIQQLERSQKRFDQTKLGFIRTLLRILPFYRFTTLDIEIDEERKLRSDTFCGLVHNGRYAANGLALSPRSEFSDRKFEFTLIKRTYRYKYIAGLLKLLRGDIVDLAFVDRFEFNDSVIITPTRNVKHTRIDFDGSCWGFLPATFRRIDHPLAFLR